MPNLYATRIYLRQDQTQTIRRISAAVGSPLAETFRRMLDLGLASCVEGQTAFSAAERNQDEQVKPGEHISQAALRRTKRALLKFAEDESLPVMVRLEASAALSDILRSRPRR